MAENKDKKKYSTGYGGNAFDMFAEFDSLETKPKKPAASKPEPSPATEKTATPYTSDKEEIITPEKPAKSRAGATKGREYQLSSRRIQEIP